MCFFYILVSVVFTCGCWDFVLLGFHVILVLLVFLSPFVLCWLLFYVLWVCLHSMIHMCCLLLLVWILCIHLGYALGFRLLAYTICTLGLGTCSCSFLWLLAFLIWRRRCLCILFWLDCSCISQEEITHRVELEYRRVYIGLRQYFSEGVQNFVHWHFLKSNMAAVTAKYH